eukprot:scaffold114078_cov42-Prasinocladus_malaysianus.AAC.1
MNWNLSLPDDGVGASVRRMPIRGCRISTVRIASASSTSSEWLIDTVRVLVRPEAHASHLSYPDP